MFRFLAFIFASAVALQAHAVPMSFSDNQTINGPINAPATYTFTFNVPTFAPITDATLVTTSLGDWSYEGAGAALASSESMSATLDGVSVIDDLFHLNANLDAGSPNKNDNGQAIFQTLVISQAILAPLVGDGILELTYTPRFEVNVASQNSFITANLSYRYDDEGQQVSAPATIALIGLGLLGLGVVRRKKV